MDFDTFNAAEQARASKRAAAVTEVGEAYVAAVAKATEARDAALAKIDADDLAARDANEKAFNDARQKKRDDIVAAANAGAGLDPAGNPLKSNNGKKKVAAK